MARAIAEAAERRLVAKADLQLAEERLKRHITDAKHDILKWGVAGLAVILAAVYVVS